MGVAAKAADREWRRAGSRKAVRCQRERQKIEAEKRAVGTRHKGVGEAVCVPVHNCPNKEWQAERNTHEETGTFFLPPLFSPSSKKEEWQCLNLMDYTWNSRIHTVYSHRKWW